VVKGGKVAWPLVVGARA